VRLVRSDEAQVEIDLAGRPVVLEVPFRQAHLRRNLLAASAAAAAVGVVPAGRVALELSPGRGQRVALRDGVMLIDDCYNANPMSMRAALEDLAETAARTDARPVAVLGDMLELGPRELDFHAELGEEVARAGVQELITVGPLASAIAERFRGDSVSVPDATAAAQIVPGLIQPGDVVLIKGSRGVGLELVCHALSAGTPAGAGA
jgi:UDP-N-acetylmuramoyl-tripeptide--D-alanyl-D-alanine ligase